MRILVHDYAGHPFQVELSRALAARGHAVLHAFAGGLQTPRGALRSAPGDPATLAWREIPMDPAYVASKYAFARRRGMEVAYGRRAADVVRAWQPDVVLSANTPTEAQEPLLAATRAGGARFVLWLQDFYSLAVDRLLRKRLPVVGATVGAWYRRLERRQLHRSDAIVAITDDFVPLLEREFGVPRDRVRVIPNWAPLADLPRLPKGNPWALRHGLHERFVFLYTGTLGMKHDPARLLELAGHFRGRDDVRVVVVSEGLGADWLARRRTEARLEDSLVLLPYQPFETLPEVLAAGDVLVGLLEADAGVFSVPSKVLSYLCAGRPILLAVPPANLAARLVANAGAGLTVPPGSTPAFLAAASKLLENEPLRSTCGKKARSHAEQAFQMSEIVIEFENILEIAPRVTI